jgi:hypothetical protein
MKMDLNLQQPLNGIPIEANQNMRRLVIPDLNLDPESMMINSYEPQDSDAISSSTDDSVNKQMKISEGPVLVLALQAPPINFMHLEILPEDLMDENDPEWNLNEAPMEQNELQLVVYSPDQATHHLAVDVPSHAAEIAPQPI